MITTIFDTMSDGEVDAWVLDRAYNLVVAAAEQSKALGPGVLQLLTGEFVEKYHVQTDGTVDLCAYVPLDTLNFPPPAMAYLRQECMTGTVVCLLRGNEPRFIKVSRLMYSSQKSTHLN